MSMSIEKAIAASIEPIVDELVALDKKLAEVSAQRAEKGEPGKDADPAQVAGVLVEKHAEALRGAAGLPGAPGADGRDADPELVATILVSKHADALRGLAGRDGRDGQDGRDADPAAVASELVAKHTDLLRGAPGQDGQDGQDADPEAVAAVLAARFADLLRGQDGQDADPEAVAAVLATKHADALRAPPVDVVSVAAKLLEDARARDVLRGEKGEPGRDGRDADPVEVDLDAVRDALKGDPDFIAMTKGADGRDATPIEVEVLADEMVAKHLAVLRGKDGADGRDGEDGADGRDGEDGAGLHAKVYVKEAVYREGEVVQAHIGQFFKATRDTVGAPGKSEDWQRVGNSGFRFLGVRPEDEASLKSGDLYIDGGSTFLVLEDGKLGKMFVQKGQKGDRGDKGDPGDKGDKGSDAPRAVAMEFIEDELVLAFDDGSLMSADCSVLSVMRKTLFAETQGIVQKLGFAIEQIEESASDVDSVPLRSFRGIWRDNKGYTRGDVVKSGKVFWLAVKDPVRGSLGEPEWIKFGGGGGGNSGGNPNAVAPRKPTDGTILNALVWDPAYTDEERWTDGRGRYQVVEKLDDLNDRVLLPLSHLVTGKLVYVTSAHEVYQFIADPAAATGTALDWRKFTTAIRYADREGNLPTVTSLPPPENGELWAVRATQDGHTVYRLFSWDTSIQSAAPAKITSLSHALSAALPVANPASVDVTFALTGTLDQDGEVDVNVTVDGVAQSVTVPVSRLDTLADVTRKVALAAGFTDITIAAQSSSVLRFTPDAPAHTIDALSFATRDTGTALPLLGGGWRSLDSRVYLKDTRTDLDVVGAKEGDFGITLERNHVEAKVFAAGAWHEVFAEDTVKNWIAAMSLFEGTAQEVGGHAIGAVEFGALPDLAAMTTAGDLSKISHYWTFIGTPNYVVKATDPGIGADLLGAVLNPGDWLQVANRGTVAAPDLHWVTVGGDLLAKARADRLFGLTPWTAGGWERGSLVSYKGDIYRAKQGVTATDPPPQRDNLTASVPAVAGSAAGTIAGTNAQLPATATVGAFYAASAAGSFGGYTGQPAPFDGVSFAAGDRFLWSGDAAIDGLTSTGKQASHGWVRYVATPAGNPASDWPTGAVEFVVQDTAPTPWEKVDISGGLKIASTDADLPPTAPAGEVWIVLGSAKAGGKQTLYAYDTAANAWTELGGGGVPMDLSKGTELIGIGLPIGSITAYASNTPPPGWLLCNAQPIPGEYKELIAICGQWTPDLRDQFIRGARVDPADAARVESVAGFAKHQSTTGLPRKEFKTTKPGDHKHIDGSPTAWPAYGAAVSNKVAWSGGTDGGRFLSFTSNSGDHEHTVIGGDTETAPDHVRLVYIIKAADRFIRARNV